MLVRVLRRFRYSVDGINVEEKHAGDVFDCRADAAPGLVAEKYVETIVDKKAEGPAPENQALGPASENKHKQRR